MSSTHLLAQLQLAVAQGAAQTTHALGLLTSSAVLGAALYAIGSSKEEPWLVLMVPAVAFGVFAVAVIVASLLTASSVVADSTASEADLAKRLDEAARRSERRADALFIGTASLLASAAATLAAGATVIT